MTDPKDDLKRLEPYLSDFAEAALLHLEDTALLCGIALRETWAGWAPGYHPKGSHLGRGDGGHGFGLFQMDDRGPYKKWPKEAPEASPYLQARWACMVLEDARHDLVRWAERIESRSFLEACLCAYNAGAGRVAWQLSRGDDPNLVTSGGDYGRNVLARRDRLRAEHPDRFPPFLPPGGVA